jgi:hypothetical protein
LVWVSPHSPSQQADEEARQAGRIPLLSRARKPVSRRKVAKVLGVDDGTVRGPCAEYSAAEGEKPKETKGPKNDNAGYPAPALSGGQASILAEKAEKIMKPANKSLRAGLYRPRYHGCFGSSGKPSTPMSGR